MVVPRRDAERLIALGARADAAWAGYNVGVVAFGQTGTGKTRALVGATQGRGRGITPRLAEALFARVDAERESNDGETRVEVTAVDPSRAMPRPPRARRHRRRQPRRSRLHLLPRPAPTRPRRRSREKRPIPILAFARRHAHHPHAFPRVHRRDAPAAAGEPTAPRRPRRRRARRRRSFPSRARRRRRVRRRGVSRTRRTRTRARRRRGGVLDLPAPADALPRTLRREREDVDRRAASPSDADCAMTAADRFVSSPTRARFEDAPSSTWTRTRESWRRRRRKRRTRRARWNTRATIRRGARRDANRGGRGRILRGEPRRPKTHVRGRKGFRGRRGEARIRRESRASPRRRRRETPRRETPLRGRVTFPSGDARRARATRGGRAASPRRPRALDREAQALRARTRRRRQGERAPRTKPPGNRTTTRGEADPRTRTPRRAIRARLHARDSFRSWTATRRVQSRSTSASA